MSTLGQISATMIPRVEAILIGVGAVIALALVWVVRRTGRVQVAAFTIPPGVSFTAQPLLTEAEAFLYNLIRLAVQDRFLVFAQVPLWSLVEIASEDRKTRSAILGKLALKRLDFVLVHPGTRMAVKVVKLDEPLSSPQRRDRDRLVEQVLQAAGIAFIRLKTQGAYTVPALSNLLGLDPPES
ncbi:MAG TPA: DUF2726 domain-containing protein [Nitrospiraceae bacterium]|nr:DUF2726 domain-containing protein [Nitrospiraceae bacterium]